MYIDTPIAHPYRDGRPAPQLNERENREKQIRPDSADWMTMEHESASHIHNPRSDLSGMEHFRASFYDCCCNSPPPSHPFYLSSSR